MIARTARPFSLVVALVVVLALAPLAFAKGGKPSPTGGGGGGSSAGITLVLMNSTDGSPHFGQDVTFNVSTSATSPWVHLVCKQNSKVVAEGRYGAFASYKYAQYFHLGPTNYWTGGAADCTASVEVYGGRSWSVLGSTSFHVYA